MKTASRAESMEFAPSVLDYLDLVVVSPGSYADAEVVVSFFYTSAFYTGESGTGSD